MKVFSWIVGTIVVFLCPINVSIAEDKNIIDLNTKIDLHECSDKGLGVKFLCNPDWRLETDKNAILVIVSEDPAVTMTIARSESPVIFLDQITQPVLKEMGQYADGFRTEEVKITGLDAIKVKGTPVQYPEIEVVDYYMIHNFDLYSVLFSVNPQDRFKDYEHLFNTMIDSVEFLEESSS